LIRHYVFAADYFRLPLSPPMTLRRCRRCRYAMLLRFAAAVFLLPLRRYFRFITAFHAIDFR